MKKLISMTDYVLQPCTSMGSNSHLYVYENELEAIRAYAQFLKRPLELGMFVPVDGLANVIRPNTNTCQYDFEVEQQALSRVLFEGFELVESGDFKGIATSGLTVFAFNDVSNEWEYYDPTITTIEHLVPFNLKLKTTI